MLSNTGTEHRSGQVESLVRISPQVGERTLPNHLTGGLVQLGRDPWLIVGQVIKHLAHVFERSPGIEGFRSAEPV